MSKVMGRRAARQRNAAEGATPDRHDAVGADGADAAYRKRLLLVVMAAVMGFGSLMTIVTVSLAVIAEDLQTSRTTLGWIVTGLMLAMAVFTPLGGKLGDIRGHRRMFLIGLVGSVITTVLCALAWNAASLIAFRVLFGMSGALVQPNGMALMMTAYGAKKRATAMGWFQFATTGAPTIGLVVGGPMVDVIGWRGIFWVFAGVTVVALGLALRIVRESERGAVVPLDVIGSVSLAGTIAFTLLAVSRAVRAGMEPLVLGLAVAAVLSLVWFLRTERRHPHPLLRLDYFRRPTFTAPLVANAANQFAYMGGFVVVPLLLGDRYGYGVGLVALLMAPRPGAFALCSPLGGIITTKVGEGIPMIAASTMMVTSMGAFALGSTSAGIAFVLLGLVLSGASAGIGSPAYTTLVAGSVDAKDLGVATGMNQTMLFVGIVSGIQIMLVVLGESPDQSRYVWTFLFGAAVAVVGLAASTFAANRRLRLNR
ncbi:MAG: MFS transporter [Acidimicrobiia bacterium]